MNYLITGASSGIGLRCTQRLLKQGHRCVLVARRIDILNEIVGTYGESRVIAVKADLRDIENIKNIFSCITALLPLDGMIHCAGVSPLACVEECNAKNVLDTYTVNVFSFLELMRLFVGKGAYNENSSVVVMSSVTAQRASNRQAIYSGTKAALEATVRCMAKELLSRKIRINCLTSGVVETPMLESLREKSPQLDEKIGSHSPLGVIPIDEVCCMIEYLLSDNSRHITGVSMPLDAGFFL